MIILAEVCHWFAPLSEAQNDNLLVINNEFKSFYQLSYLKVGNFMIKKRKITFQPIFKSE